MQRDQIDLIGLHDCLLVAYYYVDKHDWQQRILAEILWLPEYDEWRVSVKTPKQLWAPEWATINQHNTARKAWYSAHHWLRKIVRSLQGGC